MRLFDKSLEFHFKQTYDGKFIFYPWSFGYGYILPEVWCREPIMRFLRSFYLLMYSAAFSIMVLWGFFHGLAVAALLLVAYRLALLNYTKGLAPSSNRLTLEDFLRMRSAHLNIKVCYAMLYLYLAILLVFFIKVLTAPHDRWIYMIGLLSAMVFSYGTGRMIRLKKFTPH